MKTIKIKLDEPIQAGGKEVAELEIRKPTVRDLKASNVSGKSDLERSLVLIGNLSGLVPSELEELSLTDLGRINDELIEAGFLPQPPTTPKS